MRLFRPHALVAALAGASALAGCHESPTAPLRPVTAPVPSGLSVRLVPPGSGTDDRPAPASAEAAGDSLVVAATMTGVACGVTSVSAGVADGVLVVTRLTGFPPEGVACLAIARGPSLVRVVVRPAPRGRYPVAVRERFQRSAGGTEFDEREVARLFVALP